MRLFSIQPLSGDEVIKDLGRILGSVMFSKACITVSVRNSDASELTFVRFELLLHGIVEFETRA